MSTLTSGANTSAIAMIENRMSRSRRTVVGMPNGNANQKMAARASAYHCENQ
jgi:hypothetical protein